jgi:SAM-dependent methyltransferase
MVSKEPAPHRKGFSANQRSFLVPARASEIELLEQGVGSATDVHINLNEMWRLNRYFGGVKALTCHLYPLLRQHGNNLRVVDLGTGSGEIPLDIARWAQQQMLTIEFYLLDLSHRNIQYAHENTKATAHIHLLQANARSLPFALNQVDYYISSLFLHHFEPEQVVDLLREIYQHARCGMIMSDLVRGYVPLMAFHIIAPVFARHTLTRHDGALSIRRAYTPGELTQMAYMAGIEQVCIYRNFPWRMTLVAEKPHV